MKYMLVVCLLLVAGCSAGPAPAPKSVLTEIIETVIENNRENFANIEIERISIGDSGELTGLTITNVETIKIEALKAPNPISTKVSNFTLSLEFAEASGSYSFTGLEIPDLGVTLTGSGAASGRIDGGRIEMIDLDFKLVGLSGIELQNFKSIKVSIDSASLTLEGQDQAVSDQLAGALPGFLADDLSAIIADNKAAIIEQINKILSGI